MQASHRLQDPLPGFLNLSAETTSAIACEFIPPHWHSQGPGLQSFYPKAIDNRFQPSCSFVVACTSWISSDDHWQFPLPDRLTYVILDPGFRRPLAVNSWFPSCALVNPEALIPLQSASYSLGFHPLTAIAALLTFLSSEVSGFAALELLPSSFKVRFFLRVLLQQKLDSPSMRSPPPMDFLPFDLNFKFKTALS